MKRRFYIILGVIVMILLMASCSSIKTQKSPQIVEGMTEMEYLENVFSNMGEWETLTAKMLVTLDLEEKSVTQVNSTLRIKKGEVIQISITPILGIEIGRIEISSDGILMIDRMNKRYVQVSFDEIRSSVHLDLDFYALQALLLNELFIPGKADLTLRDVSSFYLEPKAEGVLLNLKKTKRFNYQFLTKAPKGLLLESLIGLNGTDYALIWRYDDFRLRGKKLFPMNMRLSLEGVKKPVKVALSLSRLSTNASWEVHTEVPKKYERVNLDVILKFLLKK